MTNISPQYSESAKDSPLTISTSIFGPFTRVNGPIVLSRPVHKYYEHSVGRTSKGALLRFIYVNIRQIAYLSPSFVVIYSRLSPEPHNSIHTTKLTGLASSVRWHNHSLVLRKPGGKSARRRSCFSLAHWLSLRNVSHSFRAYASPD